MFARGAGCERRNPRLFNDLYIVFECMDLDLMKLGRDVKQSLTLEHVRWFMYQVPCRVVRDAAPCVVLRLRHSSTGRPALVGSPLAPELCARYVLAPLPPPPVPCEQLMKSLRYIHSAGIIHRDIKPANLLLSESCQLKVRARVGAACQGKVCAGLFCRRGIVCARVRFL